jgi:hypothetical protein
VAAAPPHRLTPVLCCWSRSIASIHFLRCCRRVRPPVTPQLLACFALLGFTGYQFRSSAHADPTTSLYVQAPTLISSSAGSS